MSETYKMGSNQLVPPDISMPIVNGLEATRQLKETGCSAKIIILTVHEDQELVGREGSSDYAKFTEVIMEC